MRQPSEDRADLLREAAALGRPQAWHASLAAHARTFRFAGRWLPEDSADLIAGLYAWCRFTDDLVDESDLPPERTEARLEAWAALSREAWEAGVADRRAADAGPPAPGAALAHPSPSATRVPLLDGVLGESARRGIPFVWAEELLAGVRMDLRPRRYGTRDELALYTRRVAGVVGAWMTEIFGVHDRAVLDEALRMGHAMQLTNILRDVGEDWERGRLYLPADLLAEHGLAGGSPPEWVPEPGRVEPAYAALLGELAAEADAAYDRAFRAIPALPRRFRVAMAVAARAYQGILRDLERGGWDNVHRRAHTTAPGKAALAARAVAGLAALRLRG